MITIKRYANRKLYDTQAGRYVTLDEIGNMIRRGDDLRVIDHASGADLTTLTLLQVVLEQQKGSRAWLPQHLLARLIRAGESRFFDLRDAVLTSLDSPVIIDQEIIRRIDRLVEQDQLAQEEAERLKQLLMESTPSTAERSSEEKTAVSSEDIQALIAEVERLNAAMDEISNSGGTLPD